MEFVMTHPRRSPAHCVQTKPPRVLSPFVFRLLWRLHRRHQPPDGTSHGARCLRRLQRRLQAKRPLLRASLQTFSPNCASCGPQSVGQISRTRNWRAYCVVAELGFVR